MSSLPSIFILSLSFCNDYDKFNHTGTRVRFYLSLDIEITFLGVKMLSFCHCNLYVYYITLRPNIMRLVPFLSNTFPFVSVMFYQYSIFAFFELLLSHSFRNICI